MKVLQAKVVAGFKGCLAQTNTPQRMQWGGR
jgi:hypothetical protein